IMQVAGLLTLAQDWSSAPYPLGRQIQRNVKNLVRSFAAQAPQKTEVVFDVFQDIQAKQEIESRRVGCNQVRAKEAEPVVFSLTAQRKCLGRDFIPEKISLRRQSHLQLFENLAGATTNFADRPRL